MLAQHRVVWFHEFAVLHGHEMKQEDIEIFSGPIARAKTTLKERRGTYDKFEILGECEAQDGEHALERIRGIIDAGV